MSIGLTWTATYVAVPASARAMNDDAPSGGWLRMLASVDRNWMSAIVLKKR